MGYPNLQAEVKYACREYVRHVGDFLAYRSRLAFLNTHAANQAVFLFFLFLPPCSRLAFLNTHAANQAVEVVADLILTPILIGQAVEVVADLMAVELHWSEGRKEREIREAET